MSASSPEKAMAPSLPKAKLPKKLRVQAPAADTFTAPAAYPAHENVESAVHKSSPAEVVLHRPTPNRMPAASSITDTRRNQVPSPEHNLVITASTETPEASGSSSRRTGAHALEVNLPTTAGIHESNSSIQVKNTSRVPIITSSPKALPRKFIPADPHLIPKIWAYMSCEYRRDVGIQILGNYPPPSQAFTIGSAPRDENNRNHLTIKSADGVNLPNCILQFYPLLSGHHSLRIAVERCSDFENFSVLPHEGATLTLFGDVWLVDGCVKIRIGDPKSEDSHAITILPSFVCNILRDFFVGDRWSHVYEASVIVGVPKTPPCLDYKHIKFIETKADIQDAIILKTLADKPSHAGKKYVLQSFGHNLDDPTRGHSVQILQLHFGTLESVAGHSGWARKGALKAVAIQMILSIAFLHSHHIVHSRIALKHFLVQGFAPGVVTLPGSRRFLVSLANFGHAQSYRPASVSLFGDSSEQGTADRLPFNAEQFQNDIVAFGQCLVDLLLPLLEADVNPTETPSTSFAYCQCLSKIVKSDPDDQDSFARLLQRLLKPFSFADATTILSQEWFVPKPPAANNQSNDEAGPSPASAHKTNPTAKTQRDPEPTVLLDPAGTPQNAAPKLQDEAETPRLSSPRKRRRIKKATAVDDDADYKPSGSR